VREAEGGERRVESGRRSVPVSAFAPLGDDMTITSVGDPTVRWWYDGEWRERGSERHRGEWGETGGERKSLREW
jgi:hypothetical protein